MPHDATIQTPYGNNSLSSFALYFQRLYYKNNVYPSNIVVPLDTWYDKQFYGLVDREQSTIAPRLATLTAFRTTDIPNLLAFGFVVDAFEDFAAHMQKGVITGVLNRTGNLKLTNMKAMAGYTDTYRAYIEYLDQIYQTFADRLSTQDYNEIINFDTFLSKFTPYLKRLTLSLPVTQTSYRLSGLSSALGTGLSVAIDGGRPEDDTYKYDNFIHDPNFAFYIKSAKKFGFTVNKNIPWILTADLFSDAIMKYLRNYRAAGGWILTNRQNFFDRYYHQVHLSDIDTLKNFMVTAYNNFRSEMPLYETAEFSEPCDRINFESLYRPPIPVEVDNILTDKFMVSLYTALRSNEAGNPLPSLRTLEIEIAGVYNTQANKAITRAQNAAAYIDSIFRDYIYDISYTLLTDKIVRKMVDNQARSGNILTAGAISQQLY